MDPKLAFWTVALANLGALVGIALAGIRYARRGEIARHRRAMKIASLMVLGFLAAYVLKVIFLGREDQSVWTLLDVWVLRIHELFVVVMIVAGGVAWMQGLRLATTRLVTHETTDPVPDARTLRIHRLAGRSAVIGGLLAFVTAIGVLLGMVARLG